MSNDDAHLLIVDDDERIRGLLQKFLIRSGFLVSTARDAAHARRILSGLEFDMIVLDVMMPGEDGMSLCRDLRQKITTPIMLLTAKGGTDDRLIAERKTKGLIKVMVVKGRPVGASIAGHMAGELIGMWAMAIANKMKMSAIANTVLPYPTVSEVNKRAAGAYFSPRLFDNPTVKRVVGFVQRWLP